MGELVVFKDRLKQAIKDQDIKAADLAKNTGLSPSSISKWLSGKTPNIKKDSYVITLEILGKQLSSEDFAFKIDEITKSGISELVFVIGSSCGISSIVSQRANFKLSISKMTFLHQFARLLLVEQIYRAFKILKGETYHK